MQHVKAFMMVPLCGPRWKYFRWREPHPGTDNLKNCICSVYLLNKICVSEWCQIRTMHPWSFLFKCKGKQIWHTLRGTSHRFQSNQLKIRSSFYLVLLWLGFEPRIFFLAVWAIMPLLLMASLWARQTFTIILLSYLLL